MMANPNRAVSVVFTTDGIPQGCGNGNTIAAAAMEAQVALTGTPPVKTYVLGVGPALQSLNAIAMAGGTNMAYLVDAAMGNVTDALIAALKAIVKPLGCDYTIPTNGQPLDYGQVNVQVKIGANGAPMLIGKVNDAAACTTSGGWYYDVNPPGKPTKITLCPDSCSPLTMTDGSSLQVLIGCASIVPPPPK